jgi:hypothetical protein
MSNFIPTIAPRQYFPNIVSTWSVLNHWTQARIARVMLAHGNTIIVFFVQNGKKLNK